MNQLQHTGQIRPSYQKRLALSLTPSCSLNLNIFISNSELHSVLGICCNPLFVFKDKPFRFIGFDVWY